MLLENKTAILYGGGGHIGSTVARIFAREGARVFLAGRTLDPLDSIASEIVAAGGQAGTAQVDATDPKRVEAHFASVVDQAGGVDISFNLIALADVQGQELADMSLDDYMRPLALGARTHFITATTAARHMTRARPRRHHGDHGRALAPCFAARRRFGTVCGAIEGMLRTLAAEVGPKGVARVLAPVGRLTRDFGRVPRRGWGRRSIDP